MNFRRTVGQEIPKRVLARTVKDGAIRTLAFVGPEGVGKATLALEFAYNIAEVYGVGRDVLNLTCPDFHVISPVPPERGKPRPLTFYESRATIGIGDVRRLKLEAVKPPVVLPYRIVLVMNAESATVQAQNAMLKLLEEGGRRTLFVLVVSYPFKVLPTVLSRAAKIRFSPLGFEDFAEVVGVEDRTLYEVSGHSPGIALILKGKVKDLEGVVRMWKEVFMGSRTATTSLLKEMEGAGQVVLRVGYYALREALREGLITYEDFKRWHTSLGRVEEGYRRHLPEETLRLLSVWNPKLMHVDPLP